MLRVMLFVLMVLKVSACWGTQLGCPENDSLVRFSVDSVPRIQGFENATEVRIVGIITIAIQQTWIKQCNNSLFKMVHPQLSSLEISSKALAPQNGIDVIAQWVSSKQTGKAQFTFNKAFPLTPDDIYSSFDEILKQGGLLRNGDRIYILRDAE